MYTFPLRFSIAFTFLIFFFYLPVLQSQANHKLNFTVINSTDGLPNNNVNDIVKDNLGFIWIATNDGLCRYESSNHVKIYKENDSLIPTGLKSSNIRSLFADSKDNLWIGTVLGGLSCYHQPTNTWTTYRHDSEDPNSISSDEVLTIMEDRKGQVWVGTENGLNVFHPETATFTSFLPTKNKANTLREEAILSIMEDDKGLLWVGTWAGGFYLVLPAADGNIEHTAFRRFQPFEDLQASSIWKIYQDNDKRYWLGTHGGGLLNMTLPKEINNNITNQNWKPSFHPIVLNTTDDTQLSGGIITDVLQDKEGHLWVSTLSGLRLIQPQDLNLEANKTGSDFLHLTCTPYRYNPDDPKSITHNNVSSIYEDDQGIVWLATNSGISKYNWYTNQFEGHELFQQISDKTETQNYYIDEKGLVWITTDDKGLMQYDVNTKVVSEFKYNNLLTNLNVTAMHSPDGLHLCIGTKQGVSLLNMKTKEVINFPTPEWLKFQHPDFNITTLYYDSQNRIWLGTPNGLFVVNGVNREYTYYQHDRTVPHSICDNSINYIMEDHRGNIWIATYNGLSRLDHKTGFNKMIFESFKHDTETPENSIPSNRLTSIVEIEGKLYIGSINGLSSYDPATKQFIDLSKNKDKYCFQSLEKTKEGNIWASTTGGIVFYDMDKATFNRFEKADGLGDITFRTGSSGQDEKGNFYFGSRRGITRFNPEKLIRNRDFPPVHITEIKTMSPNEVKQVSGIFQEKLVLNHDDYYLSIDFAGLNYNRSEKNRYAYQLIGFDKEWVYENHNLSAVYTNLKAGEYQFHVKAANNDGLWNAVGQTLYITVKPAFWETSWFIGGCIFLLSSFIFGLFQLYTKNVRSRNNKLQHYNEKLNNEITERKKVETALYERDQHLEKLVTERTGQLKVKNNEVKELLDKITIRNEELETIIDQRTKSLRSSNDELIRSNKDLEQFAYIASHDLQEPLRTIGSFIGLLGRNYKEQLPEEALQYIAFANDGVHRMSNLIKSLLTYSKVGREGIEFSITNLNFLLSYKLIDLAKKIEERNVVIEMDCLPEIHCEQNQLGMVFYNLVNNAIKFNNSTTPTIKIKRHDDAPEGFWKFSVQDNGIGIDEKYQEKIFEIFSRLHGREYEGTGIGLALCQKIVYAHGGKIWLESTKGEGTTFFLTISKQIKELVEEEEEDNGKTLLKKMYN
ncbi:MAG: ligand-binding sensor domain-containing protein/signal transduction histidine kinase [Polaribacter sp.]|jgi:ligand-binding sensor domain-containing protein/signal transduction histidine kinase